MILASPLLLIVLCSSLILAPTSLALKSHKLIGTNFGVPGTDASYDYVIVGGGTAGLTVAARLAANSANTVAVIEAGGFYEIENGIISTVPGDATLYTGADRNDTQPLIDWGFETVPQAGAAGRRLHYARGKTLGGSSARNFMLYQRPTVGSLQMFADAVGDESYTFPALLPYYKRSVQFTLPSPSLYHNSTFATDPTVFSPSGGPLQVSYSNFLDVFPTWLQLAFEQVGLRLIDGFNSGKLIGSSFVTWTIDPKNAHRSSSESSFLKSVLGKTGLLVYTHSLVEKIHFDEQGAAIGVAVSTAGTYGTPGVSFTLTANKEVILSAGAFQSPQLLMVSGIGPKATLDSLGIPVVKDLPGVGQNLWDQVFFDISRRVNFLTASALLADPTIAAEAFETYVQNASGPLSILGGGYFAWEKLPTPYRNSLSASSLAALATFPADWPELEWLAAPGFVGYNRNQATSDPDDGYNYASIFVALVSPLSRGNVTIRSASMQDPPLINPNWLTDPADVELAIQAFKRTREIWDVLASLNITVTDYEFPGAAVQTDAEILQFIQEALITVWHASATCKMGRANDTMAVVDTSGRVFGTQNLRIVDASIFPFLPPGHPQSTVYAIAEKIAEDILESDKKRMRSRELSFGDKHVLLRNGPEVAE